MTRTTQLSDRQLKLIRNVNDCKVTSIVKLLGLHSEVTIGLARAEKVIEIQRRLDEVK